MPPDEIPLSGPDVTAAEAEMLAEVLSSGRLSIGPKVEAFEQAVARLAGRKYGIAVNSGTSGLHLCVRALGISDGDEVVTTPFSFVATTNCLLFERARPVFVDIDPDSYNMDPAAAAAAVTPRTKAILPVEVFGNPEHFDRYERIAAEGGLALIEDCCEALGASLEGRPAGSFGECGVFAFYPNKQITTGEGGLIVTDRQDIRDLARSMRNQGRDTNAWLSHARLGYNYRMSELNAAVGLVQAGRLDEILRKRRRVAEMYDRAIGEIPQAVAPPMHDRATASWFVYVVRLAEEFDATRRDAVLSYLKSEGVGCGNYFVPIHTQPFVMEMLGTKAGDFPVCEAVAARTIALPFHANLRQSEVDRVAETLSRALARA
jgi:perosamine synthetase